MRRKLLQALTALVIVVSGSAAMATPAHASDAPGFICLLNQNTWLRTWPQGPVHVITTLTAGRGFRAHGQISLDGVQWWYGHGAEAPSLDGWIPKANAYNCYWP